MDLNELKDQLNSDIISLLLVSNLNPQYKKAWIAFLGYMNEVEKNKLKALLISEVNYEKKVEADAAEKLLGALSAKISEMEAKISRE